MLSQNGHVHHRKHHQKISHTLIKSSAVKLHKLLLGGIIVSPALWKTFSCRRSVVSAFAILDEAPRAPVRPINDDQQLHKLANPMRKQCCQNQSHHPNLYPGSENINKTAFDHQHTHTHTLIKSSTASQSSLPIDGECRKTSMIVPRPPI